MKINLISPIFSDLGISTIAPLLRKEGHEVKILFVPELMEERLSPVSGKTTALVNDFLKGSDLIGINGFSEGYHRISALVDNIKKTMSAPVVWGGIHATIRPEDCIKHADIVCVGEGEEAMLELTSKMQRGEKLENIRSLLFRSNGDDTTKVELRPPVDLNSLLSLDYNLDSQYILENNKVRNVMESDFKGLFIVFSSRGCPFSCSYCCNSVILKMYGGRKYLRQRSVENIIADLRNIKSRFRSCKMIWFNDPDFLSGKTQDDIEDFSRKYKEEIGFPFNIWAHPSPVKEENIRALRGAGLSMINIGTTNGSDRIQRRVYNRNATADLYRAKGAILRKYGVNVEYDLIICNPYEGEDDIISTIELLMSLPKPFRVVICSLTYFPKTPLYEAAMKDGLVGEGQGVLSYTKAAYKAWKFRGGNEYLNIVASLMRGQARRIAFLGIDCYGVFLPEPILKFLIKKPVVRFFNHLPLRSFFYRVIGGFIIASYSIGRKISSLLRRHSA